MSRRTSRGCSRRNWRASWLVAQFWTLYPNARIMRLRIERRVSSSSTTSTSGPRGAGRGRTSWDIRASEQPAGRRWASPRRGRSRERVEFVRWIVERAVRQTTGAAVIHVGKWRCVAVIRHIARTDGRWRDGSFDARAGIRTRTGLPPRDFKSRASTSFATRAGAGNIPAVCHVNPERYRRAPLPRAGRTSPRSAVQQPLGRRHPPAVPKQLPDLRPNRVPGPATPRPSRSAPHTAGRRTAPDEPGPLAVGCPDPPCTRAPGGPGYGGCRAWHTSRRACS